MVYILLSNLCYLKKLVKTEQDGIFLKIELFFLKKTRHMHNVYVLTYKWQKITEKAQNFEYHFIKKIDLFP